MRLKITSGADPLTDTLVENPILPSGIANGWDWFNASDADQHIFNRPTYAMPAVWRALYNTKWFLTAAGIAANGKYNKWQGLFGRYWFNFDTSGDWNQPDSSDSIFLGENNNASLNAWFPGTLPWRFYIGGLFIRMWSPCSWKQNIIQGDNSVGMVPWIEMTVYVAGVDNHLNVVFSDSSPGFSQWSGGGPDFDKFMPPPMRWIVRWYGPIANAAQFFINEEPYKFGPLTRSGVSPPGYLSWQGWTGQYKVDIPSYKSECSSMANLRFIADSYQDPWNTSGSYGEVRYNMDVKMS